jgi:hypothetical protein
MKQLFGGLIAIILLGLYVYTVLFAILAASCTAAAGCAQFTDGFTNTMTTVSGLVSALVIAELAITNPGDSPAARAMGVRPADLAAFPAAGQLVLKVVTIVYVLVWVFVGLAAYVVGAMWYPAKLQPLTDLGQAWIGLAVPAAYAYLGIRQ